MKLTSHLLQRVLKLDPPLTRDIVVEHDLRVPTPDGVELLADRWAPRSGGSGLPTALLRSPMALQVDGQQRRFATLRQLTTGRKRRRALFTLPLHNYDVAAC